MENGTPKEYLDEKNSNSALLHDIKKYIDDNYYEPLSLRSISDKFYISQSHLSHLFKKKLNMSPMHYIARRRIGEAQNLLILSKTSITDIATAVGFDNLSHFNARFKEMVGLSPLAYRKKYLLPDPENDENYTD